MQVYRHKISYFSVPKCACSSAKSLLFEIENGFPFKPFRVNDKLYGIHPLAKCIAFDKQPHDRIADHVKVAIVRDPVARILSCYEDKIAKGKAFKKSNTASIAAANKRKLPLHPDFSEFVERIDEYRRVSTNIAHHSNELRFFLGNTTNTFDRIFDMSELPDFAAYLSEISGTKVEMPHRNKSNRTVPREEISEGTRALIAKKYESDYKIFGAFFKGPTG
jgi:hypothetical protein